MGMESMGSGAEVINPLRKCLEEINSPLARLVEGMDNDALTRLDYAFNLVGVNFNILGYVKDSTVAKDIFGDIEVLVSINNGIEKTKAAEDLRIRIIENLS